MARIAATNGLEKSVIRWVNDLGGRFSAERLGDTLSDAALGVAKTTAAVTRNLTSMVAPVAVARAQHDRMWDRIAELQRAVAVLNRRLDDLTQRLERRGSRAKEKAPARKRAKSATPRASGTAPARRKRR